MSVALVTGGARRVGAAFSEALAARGYAVAIHHHRSAVEAARLAERLGGGARVFAADLEQQGSADALITAVTETLGPIDVLVNNAANFVRTPLDTVSEAEWDRIVAVNLRAPFFLARAAARQMPEGGVIINMADLAAFETWPAWMVHGIAKAGLVQMTRALARQLAPHIRVNAIAPGVALLPDGWTESDAERLQQTTPLQRLGTPDDLVRAMTYLLDATYVTGEVLMVDGGRHVRR